MVLKSANAKYQKLTEKSLTCHQINMWIWKYLPIARKTSCIYNILGDNLFEKQGIVILPSCGVNEIDEFDCNYFVLDWKRYHFFIYFFLYFTDKWTTSMFSVHQHYTFTLREAFTEKIRVTINYVLFQGCYTWNLKDKNKQ